MARSALPQPCPGHQERATIIMYFEVIVRVDVRHMRDDRREELIAWIKSLGVEPNDVRQAFVIVQAEQEYELHLTTYRRSPEGRIRIDRATEDAVTEPLVVPLGHIKTWPTWLNVPKAGDIAAAAARGGVITIDPAKFRLGSDS